MKKETSAEQQQSQIQGSSSGSTAGRSRCKCRKVGARSTANKQLEWVALAGDRGSKEDRELEMKTTNGYGEPEKRN